MNDAFDLVILGNGIASQSFLFWFAQNSQHANLKIAHIYNDDLAPSCTTRSTAIVSHFGITKGHSPLGDLLVDSYDFTMNFIAESSPVGVWPADHFFFAPEDDSNLAQFSKRFRKPCPVEHKYLCTCRDGVLYESYLVDPSAFVNGFNECFAKLNNCIAINDYVLEYDNSSLLTLNGARLNFKYLFDGLGAYKNLQGVGAKGKISSGSFWSCFDYNLGDRSFILTDNGKNLIYRSWNRELIISGVKPAADLLIPSLQEKSELIDWAASLLPVSDANWSKHTFGIRQKSPKRMPVWGIDGNIIYLNGLYKNGYTLGPYLGSRLAEEFSDLLDQNGG